MDVSKRAALAISGLLFAGAAALSMSATTPASGAIQNSAPCNGGGGGGGGGTTFYNPYQPYNPITIIDDL